MIDGEVDIATPQGSMNTFITRPEEGGPHPVVLFFMDAPGKREELHDMARRLGTAGYYVMLPNLYYRSAREFNVFSGDPAHSADAMWELMASLTDTMVTEDAGALMVHADGDPAADGSRIGCVGYCMSGPFSFAVANAFPDRIRAAASVHGVRLFGPESPAADVQRAGPSCTSKSTCGRWGPTPASSGIRACITDSSSPNVGRSTTGTRLSATGSASMPCSPAISSDREHRRDRGTGRHHTRR
jgi:carboxymethylenebutenolidase